jgi:predicted membrane channel-forming protein YqfA (hemolysin III family)
MFGLQSWRILHLAAVVCLFAGVVLLSSQFNSIAATRMKLHLFVYLFIYPVVFISHWVWIQGGMDDPMVWRKLSYVSVPYASFVIGLIFYLSRFPEIACKCGSVDFLGASHQVYFNVFLITIRVSVYVPTQMWKKKMVGGTNGATVGRIPMFSHAKHLSNIYTSLRHSMEYL